MVTSKQLVVDFFFQTSSLLKSNDLLQCLIILKSGSAIKINVFAKVMEFCNMSSVIDEWNSLMSNRMNFHLFFLFMFLNHSMTQLVFLHWLCARRLARSLLIYSRMFWLFLRSLLDGFINLHVGLLIKLSLWSFRVINPSAFANCSIQSGNFRFFAICFA